MAENDLLKSHAEACKFFENLQILQSGRRKKSAKLHFTPNANYTDRKIDPCKKSFAKTGRFLRRPFRNKFEAGSGLPEFFLVRTYQNEKNIPNDHEYFQMAVKYTNIFHFKALQNMPKLGF
jgi:hypothetical protein